MNQAYATRDAGRARRLLDNLARRLEHQHPSAAASLREELDETLTVMRLGLPENLEKVLSSTNLIENLFSRVREIGRWVKRWQSGTMVGLDGLRPVCLKPSAASASSPAIARSRPWSPPCVPAMRNSIVPKENLTQHRMPLN